MPVTCNLSDVPDVTAWAIGQSVAVGDLRSHNGKVWKAKVAHVTHEGW